MHSSVVVLAFAVGLSATTTSIANGTLAGDRPETHTDGLLTVVSTSIQDHAAIPPRHSAYADGISPQLQWVSNTGAKSYAVVVEDPDAKSTTPVVHWIAWNIPSTVTSLPEGLNAQASAAIVQGKNSVGSIGYFGPHPPIGDAPHHYHFQVFALDQLMAIEAGSDREAFLAAANGHVIAKGELVGLFQQPAKVGK